MLSTLWSKTREDGFRDSQNSTTTCALTLVIKEKVRGKFLVRDQILDKPGESTDAWGLCTDLSIDGMLELRGENSADEAIVFNVVRTIQEFDPINVSVLLTSNLKGETGARLGTLDGENGVTTEDERLNVAGLENLVRVGHGLNLTISRIYTIIE